MSEYAGYPGLPYDPTSLPTGQPVKLPCGLYVERTGPGVVTYLNPNNAATASLIASATTWPPVTPPANTTPSPIVNPKFSSSTNDATWPTSGTTDGFRVNNDVWSPVSGGKQTIFANSYSDWGITANVPSRTTGAIMAYGDTELCLPAGQGVNTPTPVGSLTASVASWTHGMPKAIGSSTSTDYWAEAAFDIFFGGIPGQVHKELMIWTDSHNQPYTYHKVAFTATIAGTEWTGYSTNSASATAEWFLIMVRTQTDKPVWSATGTITVYAIFRYLVAEGWLANTTNVTFIEYGFEVTTTRGKTLTFRVYNYSLTHTGLEPVSAPSPLQPARSRRTIERWRRQV
jgi:hypothetical protein